MNIRGILKRLPEKSRKGLIFSAFLTFINSLLELISFTFYIPVIYLLLFHHGDPKRQLIDSLAAKAGVEGNLNVLLITAALLVLISGLKIFLQIRIGHRINRELYNTYKWAVTSLYDSTVARGMQYVKEEGPTALTHNICITTYTLVFSVLKPLITLLSDITTILLITLITALINPYAAIALILTFTPALLYYYIYSGRMGDEGREENNSRRNQVKLVQESLRGYAEIRVNHYVKTVKERLNMELDRQIEIKGRLDRKRELFVKPVETVILVTVLLLLALSSIHAVRESITSVSAGVLMAATLKFFPAIRSVLSNSTSIKTSGFSIKILFGATSVTNQENAEALPFNSKIEIKNISFSYPDKGKVLENYNLIIDKGDIVGIKGVSGIGKSTLIHLILGLLTPEKGEITIDGKRLSCANMESWHRDIAYVSQDTFILNGTLKENIEMGNPHDHEMLERAIKAAHLKEYIDNLPEGAEHHTGETGAKLSGGLKQRIAIARAHYRNSPILIMDEATSSLDRNSEKEILECIQRVKEQKRDMTIIIVSHREAPLGLCNKITEI